MALVAGAFPYDVNTLLGGAVRVLIAPYDAGDIPAIPSDVFLQESPYTAVDPFVDLGATKEAFSYSRNIEVSGFEIQQVQGNVLEEISDSTRTITVSMAALDDVGMALIEQNDVSSDITAVAGSSAYDKLEFGTITDLDRYIIAFVARRSQASGVVTESDTTTKRGRFVVGIGYNVAVTADNAELQMGKGELSAAQLTFKFFPESSLTSGKEFGMWLFEQAGAIT